MTTRSDANGWEAYAAAARAYVAGVDDECRACGMACPEHGTGGCSLCHQHPGECGYGGCTRPAELTAIDTRPDTGAIAQTRSLCTRHMRWWARECRDGIDRRIVTYPLDRGDAGQEMDPVDAEVRRQYITAPVCV